MTDEKLELLNNLMFKADNKALDLINSKIDQFKEHMDQELKSFSGLKWDDLIVHFEWIVNVHGKIQNEANFTGEQS